MPRGPVVTERVLPRGDENDLIAGGHNCPCGDAVAALDGGWSNVNVSGVTLQVPMISPSLQPALINSPKIFGGPLWLDSGTLVIRASLASRPAPRPSRRWPATSS